MIAEQEILDELKSDSERYQRYKDFLESLVPMYETHHRARVNVWETLYYCARDGVCSTLKAKNMRR